MKYKRQPQDDFILSVYPEPQARKANGRVVRALGYDAGEGGRVVKALGLDAGEGPPVRWQTRPPPAGKKLSRDQRLDRDYFTYWYPLFEWGYDRRRCQAVIAAAGLPVPMKSACWFCAAAQLRGGRTGACSWPSPSSLRFPREALPQDVRQADQELLRPLLLDQLGAGPHQDRILDQPREGADAGVDRPLAGLESLSPPRLPADTPGKRAWRRSDFFLIAIAGVSGPGAEVPGKQV